MDLNRADRADDKIARNKRLSYKVVYMATQESLDDFETIILSHALAYGKVESGNVSTQLQETLKETGQTSVSYYEIFQKTSAKLQRRGLLDDKMRPTPHASEVVDPFKLRDFLLQAHRRINELDEEVRRKESEISQLRSQVYKLQADINSAQSRIDRMSPSTQFISKEALEKGLSQFIGHDVSSRLSNVARSDLESAMRCIFHGIHTPAAMVALRASEEAVRRYYQLKTGQEPGKMRWKDILEQLVQRDDVDKTLMGHLNYIREKRNEAEHPEKIFDAFEAENTFQTVINVIREIYREIPKT